MKKKCIGIAVVIALFAGWSACAKSEPYKAFKDLCISRLSDGKYPTAAELTAASSDIESWPDELRKKGKDVIAKGVAYEKAQNDGSPIEKSMAAMAEYGTALGAFIEDVK